MRVVDDVFGKESVPPRMASSSSPSITSDTGGDGNRSSRHELSPTTAHTGDGGASSASAHDASGSSPASLAATELQADGQWHELSIDAAHLWVAYVNIGSTNTALHILLQVQRLKIDCFLLLFVL